jgi:malate dehydrogenase (oxaloacetate-decarboxylating)
VGADVFIGLSGQPDLLTPAHIASMNTDPIIFTASNPNPEIDPALAISSGAYIIATGRSDFPNQLNNLLIFPGLFRGLLAHQATGIPDGLMISLAQTLADSVTQPHPDHIIPDATDPAVHECIYTATCAYISTVSPK